MSVCPHQITDDSPSCGPTLVCSMWITSETGTVHYGCSAVRAKAEDTLRRYREAGVELRSVLTHRPLLIY